MRLLTIAAASALMSSVWSQAYAAEATRADIKELKAAMENKLMDAGSAKIQSVVNSYGAYAGFDSFLAVKLSSGKFCVVGLGPSSVKVCADRGLKPKL
jgi:hypothetical protein